MKAIKQTECGSGPNSACFPKFKRLKYSYGQMLGADDFLTEQNFFREKFKLHNRCLHGYGTVCGLMVMPEPNEPHCESESDTERRTLQETYETLKQKKAQAAQQGDTKKAQDLDCEIEKLCRELEKYPECGSETHQCPKVLIECGLALDCEGNELIVRRSLEVDIWQYLNPEDRNIVQENCGCGGTTVYLSLCYCELPVDPFRPVVSNACGTTPGCTPGKLLDMVRVHITTKCPTLDTRCETCCEPCQDPCLLLARIDHFKPGHKLKAEQIHNRVRRLVDIPYSFTTITGINWKHGKSYDEDEVTKLFNDGLEVQFSRPVLKSTLTPGVIDIWTIEGGRGKHGGIYNVDVELDYGSDEDIKSTCSVRIISSSDDCPDPGDRLIIIIRAAFILDECCRPVDGAHVGGRVPLINLEEGEDCGHYNNLSDDCPIPLHGYGPWTSGTGYPGANFESWFCVSQPASKSGKSPRTLE
jgi:hypothetical protein